jgi:hypothetical protein
MMRETKETVGKRAHEIEYRPDGAVEIDYDQYYHGIVVYKDERAAVALALLGGLTDELVERSAQQRLDEWARAFRPTLRWRDLAEWEKERYRENSREAITRSVNDIVEFFGIEPTP